MSTTPADPQHILQAKQAAAEAGLDLAPAFTALNLAAEFYRKRRQGVPPDDPARVLRNVRKRLRQMNEILTDADTTDAKKLKKMRFVLSLLLPE